MPFNVTVTFQNNEMNNRSKDAFASAYGLTKPDGTVMTKAQNRDYRIKEYIKDITKAEETKALHSAVVVPSSED